MMNSDIFSPKRFALVFLAAAVGLVAVMILFFVLTGTSISNAGMSLIPYFVAASIEGQRFARSGLPDPEKGDIWRAAVIMGLIGLAVGLVLAAPILSGPRGAAVFSVVPPAMLAGGLAVITALGILMSRVFWGIGLRGERRAQARKKR